MFKPQNKDPVSLEYFDEYKSWLSVERNSSDLTLKSYESDFRLLEEYMVERNIPVCLDSLTVALIRTFIHHLKINKKYKNETIRRKIYSFSSYFRFLTDNDYLDIYKNPMLKIRAPRREERLPIFLPEKEIRHLIDTVLKTGAKDALRDKTIISLLALTGIRRMELVNLNWDNIDFAQKTIKIINGKGKKERILPIPELLYQDLLTYMSTMLPISHPAVFLTRTNRRITFRGLSNLFQKYIRRSGLAGKGYTLHKLRHSYASLLVQNGVDIAYVKELMGHADFNSTKIYVHLNMENLRESVDKHPLSHI